MYLTPFSELSDASAFCTMSPDILKSISTSGLLPARVLFHRVSCPYGFLLRAGCQMFWTLFSCFYDCLLIFIIFFLIDTVIDFITSSSTQLSDPLLKIMGMPVMNQDCICLLHAWRNNKAMSVFNTDSLANSFKFPNTNGIALQI